jgi:hypothetical protein
MPRSRDLPRLAASLLAVVLLPLLLAPRLEAQGAPSDGMAFPRELLASYLAGDAERVWEHAGPAMREMAESANGLREAASEISDAMGDEAAVLAEQLFDHPDGGGWQVYVRAVRHTQVPEIFWIVIFRPADRQLQMIMPQPRQTIRALFPQVGLP